MLSEGGSQLSELAHCSNINTKFIIKGLLMFSVGLILKGDKGKKSSIYALFMMKC